jgi:hypothetical protein
MTKTQIVTVPPKDSGPSVSERQQVDDLCAARAECAKVRDDMAAKVDEYSAQIGSSLAILGVNKLETPQFLAQLVDGHRKSLSKTKLVELGVPLGIIMQAEVETPFVQVRVTRRRYSS